MILQALNELYGRKKAVNEIAPDGFIEKEIDFLIELDEHGKYLDISDMREIPEGQKKARGKSWQVPSIGLQASKHGNSGSDANLLWDNAGFALGMSDTKGDKKHESFVETIEQYYAPSPQRPRDVEAVLTFLKNEYPFAELEESQHGEELASGAPTVSFRIKGSQAPICLADHVKEALSQLPDEDAVIGLCLVSGEHGAIEPTHPVLKGIYNGQTTGCSLVGFNAPSFCSYGKEQSHNAPVSKRVASAYTKALQSLINSRQNKTLISDVTMLYWTQRPREKEVATFTEGFAFAFEDAEEDKQDNRTAVVKALLESVQKGNYRSASLGDFYVLGLAPNSARLAVKFWESGPIHVYAERIAQHFKDFEIVHAPEATDFLSLGRILRSTVFEYKLSNVPSNLAGEVMRSVITGAAYPRTLFLQAIRRVRAERKVTRERAAIIKAYINRKNRITQKEVSEITMSLDKNKSDTAYRLGRLFAVLEKTQDEALPNLNSGIRDRFYGAASSTPATVFPRLIKLKNHHLSKISKNNRGAAINRERLIAEIMDEISSYPRILNLDSQGQFSIGYYHQRQDLYTKNDKSALETSENNSEEE